MKRLSAGTPARRCRLTPLSGAAGRRCATTEDASCIASMERIAARAPRFARSAFVLQSTLLGQPASRRGFTALMVPPYDDDKNCAAAADPPYRAGRFEIAPVLVRQDEPTCCAPRTEQRDGESEFALRPALPAEEKEIKLARRAAPPRGGTPCELAGPGGNIRLARRLARWPIAGAEMHTPRQQRGLFAGAAARMRWPRARLRCRPAYFGDDSGMPLRPAARGWLNPCRSASKRGLCAMAAISRPRYARRRRKFGVRSAPRAKAPTAGCSSGAGQHTGLAAPPDLVSCARCGG